MSETSASQNPQEPADQEHPAQTESEREEQLVEEEERESFPASAPPANYCAREHRRRPRLMPGPS